MVINSLTYLALQKVVEEKLYISLNPCQMTFINGIADSCLANFYTILSERHPSLKRDFKILARPSEDDPQKAFASYISKLDEVATINTISQKHLLNEGGIKNIIHNFRQILASYLKQKDPINYLSLTYDSLIYNNKNIRIYIDKLAGLLVPPEISYFQDLDTLEIIQLPLSYLPNALGSLSGLKHLEIQSCPRLTHLPEYIKNFREIEQIHINDCPALSAIPFNILSELPNLQSLSIKQNELITLPESIGDLQLVSISNDTYRYERPEKSIFQV